MSYDISLKDPHGNTIEFRNKHHLAGGAYLGRTRLAQLNVTYNYAAHFRRAFGERGIRTLYGMTGRESRSILKSAISQLDGEERQDSITRSIESLKSPVPWNYWEPTEANARRALENLLELANLAPEGVWEGD